MTIQHTAVCSSVLWTIQHTATHCVCVLYCRRCLLVCCIVMLWCVVWWQYNTHVWWQYNTPQEIYIYISLSILSLYISIVSLFTSLLSLSLHLLSHCSVLQCVAVCCSVLQCVAVCCSVLMTIQHTRRNLKRNQIKVTENTHEMI